MRAPVRIRIKQNSTRRVTVTAGPADFLIITFEAAGQTGMNDGSDICFIDSHAKGNGCDDNLQLAGQKLPLNTIPYLSRHTCMVSSGGKIKT